MHIRIHAAKARYQRVCQARSILGGDIHRLILHLPRELLFQLLQLRRGTGGDSYPHSGSSQLPRKLQPYAGTRAHYHYPFHNQCF